MRWPFGKADGYGRSDRGTDLTVVNSATHRRASGSERIVSAILLVWGAGLAVPAMADEAKPADQSASQADGSEILVTARRREENLMRTPVSATVLSGDNLEQQNVRNFSDLRGAVSNLELVPLTSGDASFTVRGIGQTNNQVNSDTKAGLYVNGMYVSRQEGNSLYFYDVASLQVLKGPQGTLFGKNTTAGAILLENKRPTQDFEGYGQLRFGSYERVEVEGAVNLPLGENVSTRLSFRSQDADGFIKHLLDDRRSGDIDNKSVRLQLRAQTGALTADLLGEYNRSQTDGGAYIPLTCSSAAPYIANYDLLHKVPYCDAYPIIGKPYTVYGGATLNIPTSAAVTDVAAGGDANGAGAARQVGRSPFNDTEVWTLNGRLKYELTDDLTLNSTSAYRRSSAKWYSPMSHAPDDIYAEYDDTKTDQVSQELTLSGTALDERLNYLAGVYYFNQKTSFVQDTGPDWIDPLGYRYDSDLKFESYAAFIQASMKLTPKLEITAGGRYTRDKKSGSSAVFFAGNGSTYTDDDGVMQSCGWFVGDFLGGVRHCGGDTFTAAGAKSWSSFDPKLQISYQWTDQLYTYATAAHGYNAGGFNQQLGSQPADGRFPSSYKPEKLWSYEAGLKSDLFDHRLRFSLSAFYQKFTAIQSTVLVDIAGVATRQLQSAASAHEEGMEAEFTIRPVPDLTIRGNASYLKQAYDKIEPGATSISLDTPVNSAPKYTFSAAVDYTIHVGTSGTLTPSVDVRGLGSKPGCQSDTTFTCKLPGYALVGFRVDYVPSEAGNVRLAVYGTNVLDKETQLLRSGFYDGMGLDRYIPGRPQEFGAEISWRF